MLITYQNFSCPKPNCPFDEEPQEYTFPSTVKASTCLDPQLI